jgi:16S rRNA (guanine966-N2)-methyltransferase
MRIVAGAAKGRRLVAPKGTDVRPTSDRVKEALFSALQPVLPAARVLDLFAGSGALGLEALSRGAASVTFVERSRPARDALRRNIEVVGLPGTHVVAGEAATALRGELPGGPFDLALLDPPYHHPKAALAALLEALVVHLAPGARIVLERAARDGTPPWPAGLLPGTPRRYGDTALHIAEHVGRRDEAAKAVEDGGHGEDDEDDEEAR